MKKIGIIGTESTGKTTLCLNLQKNFKLSNIFKGLKIEILEEVCRKSPGNLNKGGTLENEQWIYYKQYVSELEKSLSGVDILMCDRTVLDPLVYSQALGFYDFVIDNIESAVKWLRTYDILFFKRPLSGVSMVDDGVRSNDHKFRKEIDMLFKYYTVKYDIDVIECY